MIPIPSPPVGVVLAILLLHLAIAIVSHFQNRKGSAETALEARTLELKRDIAALSTVSDFVAKSRRERELVKVEKDLLLIRGEGERWENGVRLSQGRADVAQLLSRRAQPALLVALCALYWGTPMLQVPDRLLWPMGWALAGRAGVGAAAWCAACSAVAARAVALLPLQTVKRGGAAGGGLMGSLMGMLGGS